MNERADVRCRRQRKRHLQVMAYRALAGVGIAGILTATLLFSIQKFEDMMVVGGTAAETEGIKIYQSAGPVNEGAGSIGNASNEGAGSIESASNGAKIADKTDGQAAAPDTEGWELILVNRWNPIPDNYDLTLTQLQNGQSVDERIYPKLQEMFDDARAAGILPAISSSYRTAETQQELMDEKIAEYQAQGYGDEEARNLAEQWVAIPGTSEHQIGIAVDITTADWAAQDASVVWEWLDQNSYRYGFILRYPEEKTEITGVMPEPWHYRYVGMETAKEIYDAGVCLEEYLGKVDSGI